MSSLQRIAFVSKHYTTVIVFNEVLYVAKKLQSSRSDLAGDVKPLV